MDIQFWLCIDCAHGINISLLWSDLICQRIEFRVAPLNDSMKTMWATIFPQKNRSFQSYRQSKFLNYFARAELYGLLNPTMSHTVCDSQQSLSSCETQIYCDFVRAATVNPKKWSVKTWAKLFLSISFI